jgi:hypothetical protein
MDGPENKILTTLLDRIYATLVHGPCLNCRVHRSRQRVDLFDITALQHLSVKEIVPHIIADSRSVEIRGKVPVYRGPEDEEDMTEKDRAARLSYEAQARLLTRLRDIAEDARDYEQETGENALYIGYPFISIPPGNDLIGAGSPNPRVLAPLALIAVNMSVKRGALQSVTLAARGDGMDLVIPNYPLLAWLENQTGQEIPEIFADDEGDQPYREIGEIIQVVARMLQIDSPTELAPETPFEAVPTTAELPNEPAFLNAAALGLFPVSNEGLLRDLKAMAAGESLSGPVAAFLKAELDEAPTEAEFTPEAVRHEERDFAHERLVTRADPFQVQAVRDAKHSPCLVIHGPPGTGKSQTITNIIGDHLARGERVLMVCDKRTAIDVVHNRLEHLGLGDLCAIVHDPQRDQRSLYMKIRNYLETLPEKRINSRPVKQLEQLDTELKSVHAEITGYFQALNLPPTEGEPSFHDMVGEWFGITTTAKISPEHLEKVSFPKLEETVAPFAEALDRAAKVDYPHNPWAPAVGITLSNLLALPVSQLEEKLSSLHGSALEFDASHPPDLPPLDPNTGLEHQAHDRELLGKLLIALAHLEQNDEAVRWLEKGMTAVGEALNKFPNVKPSIDHIEAQSLDAELSINLAGGLPPLTTINQSMAALAQYEGIADKWYGFLFFGRRSAAAEVLAGYGLPTDKTSAGRVREFLAGIKSRLLVREYYEHQLDGNIDATGLPSDSDLLTAMRTKQSVLHAVHETQGNGQYSVLQADAIGSLQASAYQFSERLNASAAHARDLHGLVGELTGADLFNPDWIARFDQQRRRNEPAAPGLEALNNRMNSLEDVVRCQAATRTIHEDLRPAAQELIEQGHGGTTGIEALRRELLTDEITRRIKSTPALQQIDQERIVGLLDRYRKLTDRKEKNAREFILYHWSAIHRDRLIDTKRKQMNAIGANLKRRLLTRGKNSMKLRQMIQYGSDHEGGDPLFDLCPVWMASPATVALVFPREPIFDVVIFDEASQCRLEEALPVLTRAKRVVIAGDPKQLPPTRFFESAIAETEVTEAESDQDLFEQQQADTEDLLSAALNLQVNQSYLDVHYRSHHESLIGFSNEHFYRSRLQPIPAHPSTRSLKPAVELVRVDGTYIRRGNPDEADRVIELVRELLAEKKPPSIGIACFNLVQRDLILDRLEDAADTDKDFGQRYETARNRQGEGSFEGIFVKNLENVQGDERDHMIISTTFGPDPQARFRRNFGPVGRQGGGRRLNVLVTRARHKIHVLTSIPRTEYRILPELEDKQSPSGRWLLYAYLNYAEQLATRREAELRQEAAEQNSAIGVVHELASTRPSSLSRWIAGQIAEQDQHSADVHWGNDGFCVDIALHHPERPDQRTMGILCDLHRFADAPDLVDWELFRTSLLEAKGWHFQRVFSPAIFRDWKKHHGELLQRAAEVTAKIKLPPIPEPATPEPVAELEPVVIIESTPAQESLNADENVEAFLFNMTLGIPG